MDISIREHMIYGDYLKPINTSNLINEEFNNFNKVLDSINILVESNILLESSFKEVIKSILNNYF